MPRMQPISMVGPEAYNFPTLAFKSQSALTLRRKFDHFEITGGVTVTSKLTTAAGTFTFQQLAVNIQQCPFHSNERALKYYD